MGKWVQGAGGWGRWLGGGFFKGGLKGGLSRLKGQRVDLSMNKYVCVCVFGWGGMVSKQL